MIGRLIRLVSQWAVIELIHCDGPSSWENKMSPLELALSGTAIENKDLDPDMIYPLFSGETVPVVYLRCDTTKAKIIRAQNAKFDLDFILRFGSKFRAGYRV